MRDLTTAWQYPGGYDRTGHGKTAVDAVDARDPAVDRDLGWHWPADRWAGILVTGTLDQLVAVARDCYTRIATPSILNFQVVSKQSPKSYNDIMNRKFKNNDIDNQSKSYNDIMTYFQILFIPIST